MTLSALVSRWFGLASSDAARAAGPTPLVLPHYEEDDAYAEREEEEESEDEAADGLERDSATLDQDDDDRYVDNYVRLSQLFASTYEEEAAHRREEAESLLDVTGRATYA